MKRSSSNKITTRGLLRWAMAAVFILATASCTVRNFERRMVKPEVAKVFAEKKDQIAVFAYVHEKNLRGSTLTVGKMAGGLLIGGTLGLFPIPMDFRWSQTPAIELDRKAPIPYTYDRNFSDQLSKALGSSSLAPPKSPASISALVSTARKAGKRYVYYVAYNEYDSIKHETASYGNVTQFRTVTGSIPLVSRLLIDTKTNKLLVHKQRLSETYFWLILSNGWDQGVQIHGRQYRGISTYIDKVGGRTEAAGLNRTIRYLIDTDFKNSKPGSY